MLLLFVSKLAQLQDDVKLELSVSKKQKWRGVSQTS